MTNRTDFNGRTTTFIHDVMNQLLEKRPDPAFGAAPIQFGYNELGLRTNMVDASGVTTYHYDNRNRLIEKVTPEGALNYAYNANGQVTNITSLNTNGAALSYTYDELNRLNELVDPHTGRTTYTYDDVGNLRGYTYPNGVNSFYSYNALNRLTNMNVSSVGGTVANYAYTLAPSGHRTGATETLILNPFNPQPTTINRLYAYDRTYRLTNETIAGTSFATATLDYSYDKVGNRLRLDSTLLSIPSAFSAVDLNDRLTTDSYDNNGNTLFAGGFPMSQPDHYDFENRLIQRVEGGKTVTIVYDGDGNRVKKTVTTATNTVTTWFLVDMINPTGYAQVLEEITTDTANPQLTTPQVTRIYSYGHDLISQDQLLGNQWEISFYGYDGHGNTRFLTDVNGFVSDTYDYDAFGNVLAYTGSTPNLYLFTGEQFDSALGLYFLRARYQNTHIGRFWTMDEFEGFSENPVTLHKYLYCSADPVSHLDPSGNLVFTSNLRYGRAVHRLISEDFAEKAIDPFTDRGLSTIIGRVILYGRLRPDLIEFGQLPVVPPQLFEIKASGSFIQGQVKLQFYLSMLNALDPRGAVWQPGFSYTPPRILDLGYGAYALVSPPIRGVILYQVVDFKEAAAVAAYELAQLTYQIGQRLMLSSLVRFAY
jgi:RHS repeat-associated protein